MIFPLRVVHSTCAMSRQLIRHYSDTQERANMMKHVTILKEQRKHLCGQRKQVSDERELILKELLKVNGQIKDTKEALKKVSKN